MFPLLAIILALMPLKATPDNEQPDSLVRLMNAQSAQLVKDFTGASYRKVIGPASFLHNNTYLICDTAIWNVDDKIINAFGNVQVLQNETVLTSDKLDYLIDENLAQFRGTTVQLQDKDGNTLRTRFLDYNTKDSVAIFERGASFRDKDGQIIESRDGTYDSKIKTFTFSFNVNMFTDSIFVKSPNLKYVSPEGKAYFYSGVDVWKGDNMLSSKDGYYSNPDSTFFFTNNVHAQTKDQEAWSDSLFIYRKTKNVLMLGNAQIKDTTRKIEALANYILYEDSVSRITMLRDAAMAAVTDEGETLDTLYIGADKVVYRIIKKCDIVQTEIAAAMARLKDLDVDAVTEYRAKAAANAKKDSEEESDQKNVESQVKDSVAVQLNPLEKRRAKLAAKQAKKEARLAQKQTRDTIATIPLDSLSISDTLALADIPSPVDTVSSQTVSSPVEHVTAEVTDTSDTRPETSPAFEPTGLQDSNEMPDDMTVASPDSTAAVTDTLAMNDTLSVKDTLAALPDTTKIGFLFANGSVRAFKKNMQMRCDSLIYSDLDSLARLYVSPIIWNEGNRQYSSDSVSILVKDSRLTRANLTSNAFVIVQEDTAYFDQIRGSEILAFFGKDGGLDRFDALGSASAVFYIEENGALATVNKVEAKMLSALLDSNKVQKVFYFDNPKNNAFPTMQLPNEDKKMKGFNWKPDDKPESPLDITSLSIRPSERKSYDNRPKANFRYTNSYFPGYIDEIYREIEVRDSLENARRLEAEQQAAKDSLVSAQSDTLAKEKTVVRSDSLSTTVTSPADSLKPEHKGYQADTLNADKKTADTENDSLNIRTPADTLANDTLIPRDKWEERYLKREERKKQREAKWAEMDARDAEKAEAKAAKKLEKQRAKTRRLLEIEEKQAIKNQKRLDRYIKQMEKQKARRPLTQTVSEGSE